MLERAHEAAHGLPQRGLDMLVRQRLQGNLETAELVGKSAVEVQQPWDDRVKGTHIPLAEERLEEGAKPRDAHDRARRAARRGEDRLDVLKVGRFLLLERALEPSVGTKAMR